MRRAVRQMIASSKEIKSTAVATSFINTVAGSVVALTQACSQGDNINNRSGDVIFPSMIHMNLSLLSGVASTNSLHRVVVFQDMFNQGAIPAVGDVLESGVYNGTYTLVLRQQKRFKILYDKMHGVVGQAESAATHLQLKLKLKGAIKYNGAANVAASNGPGAIFFLTLTDSVVVSTALVSFYANTFYTDA